MTTKVLIAHASGEQVQAEKLAGPIRNAGYEVVHEGTVLVGDSVVNDAGRALADGCPVVLCATVRAMGTKWARQVANAARKYAGVRLFVVQMEEDADTDSVVFDEVVACYWVDAIKATNSLVASLRRYYPIDGSGQISLRAHDLEARYRELALKACDIIDLANLPEDDRHLASRELELRRLYVALRMRLEFQADSAAVDETLSNVERHRVMAWGDGRRNATDQNMSLVSLGERLAAVPRLVVLGDPGAGKSTLLRWLATAYLLKLQSVSDWRDLPDIASLPNRDWLPILIRCRDLPSYAVTLDDMLQHSLRKSELSEDQCLSLRQLLRGKLESGEAILLVDGLDEITDPTARARFAGQLEQIYRAHERAPIVVTSRIVGYREMGYRIRCGFEHLTVADLTREDKDDFAHRWCALTERGERREAAAADLIHDIHSSDRIERLTGNPMLLTTMALIKRKIGRLPQRRVDLYEKAVEVLLNWRSAVDAALDPREALPQLEYIAHAMCADGIQQLREDQALDLLRQVRQDFPNIHALQQNSPEDFLALLERRTGLLMQSGHVRHNGHSVPVYEFRHLTLQEYLAGIGLVQGHYRGRNKSRSLAEEIAPLAGLTGESGTFFSFQYEPESAVVENWREALRLCLAACNDDMVDDCLLAILHPLPGEVGTERPRAVLAGLCLADEPSVSEHVAEEVLLSISQVVKEVDGSGVHRTVLDTAATELAKSRWFEFFNSTLLDEFHTAEAELRQNPGGLYGMLNWQTVPSDTEARYKWFLAAAETLSFCDPRTASGIALIVMHMSFDGCDCNVPGMVNNLILHLNGPAPASHAAAWALGWMNKSDMDFVHKKIRLAWHPSSEQLNMLLAVVSRNDCDCEALRWIAGIFLENPVSAAQLPLMTRLSSAPPKTQVNILRALGAIGDPVGLATVRDYLNHSEGKVRRAALKSLFGMCEEKIDRKLLMEHFNEDLRVGVIDPRMLITNDRISSAAKSLKLPKSKIRQRYEWLAERYGLVIEPSGKRHGTRKI